MLVAEHATNVVPGNNGVFLPMVVVAGQVVGTWKRSMRKSALDVRCKTFTSPDVLEEEAVEAARGYSDFVGLPLSKTVIRDI